MIADDTLLVAYLLAWGDYMAAPDNPLLYAKWRVASLDLKEQTHPELFLKPLGA